MEKQKLWPFFLVLWRMTNVRENILRVQKVHWKLFGSDMIIFSGPKCCLKHNFLGKKGCFSGETFFWANVSQLGEYGKLHGTIYQGAQGFLTKIVQVIRSFFRTCEVHKNNFSKKGSSFDENQFWPLFLVYPCMAHIKKHFTKLHMAFWKSICSL